MHGTAAVLVQVPVARPEVYATLADPSKRPAWIRDLRHVVQRGSREEWLMHGPQGTLRWQVESTIERPPTSLAWCFRNAHGTGYMRLDLSDHADGTRIRARRFLGFRDDRMGRTLRHWWGQSKPRLEADLAHLLEVLHGDPSSPVVNAVGFRPTASGFSRGP